MTTRKNLAELKIVSIAANKARYETFANSYQQKLIDLLYHYMDENQFTAHIRTDNLCFVFSFSRTRAISVPKNVPSFEHAWYSAEADIELIYNQIAEKIESDHVALIKHKRKRELLNSLSKEDKDILGL